MTTVENTLTSIVGAVEGGFAATHVEGHVIVQLTRAELKKYNIKTIDMASDVAGDYVPDTMPEGVAEITFRVDKVFPAARRVTLSVCSFSPISVVRYKANYAEDMR
jgi:hypothetical protein